jgi:hypothetical protein
MNTRLSEHPDTADPVRAAGGTRVRITLDRPASDDTEIVVDHTHDGLLLAHEVRPVASGQSTIEIKTHPQTTHIGCSLAAGGVTLRDRAFSFDHGERIEPVGRHFIIIGAMKAGTTTLFRLLERHPLLCPTFAETPESSFTKEINYFSNLFQPEDTPLHYDWRFPFDASEHAWTLDASPNYAKLKKSRPVAPRMAALGAELRLAYILRDPVDRIESHIAHMLRDTDTMPSMRHCIRVSRYAWHLDDFQRHIPIENILLLDFEQLSREPEAVVSQVCRFLGIPEIPVTPRVHNKRTVPYRMDRGQRKELAKILRPDVLRLREEYGFEPATRWLQQPKAGWHLLPFRRG